MRGYTLLEMVLVLSLVAVAVGMAAPMLRRYRDDIAVAGAREATAGLVRTARWVAVEEGRAVLRFNPATERVTLLATGNVVDVVDLEARWGVDLAVAGNAPLEVGFGPLGIAVVASRSLRFQRGQSRAELVISASGRMRRR